MKIKKILCLNVKNKSNIFPFIIIIIIQLLVSDDTIELTISLNINEN